MGKPKGKSSGGLKRKGNMKRGAYRREALDGTYPAFLFQRQLRIAGNFHLLNLTKKRADA